MQSFVVQNFYNSYPFTERTYRSVYAIALKYNNFLSIYLSKSLFSKPLMFSYQFTTYTLYMSICLGLGRSLISNLVLSTKYIFLCLVNKFWNILHNNGITSDDSIYSTTPVVIYPVSVPYTNINFLKTSISRLLHLTLITLMGVYNNFLNKTVILSTHLPLNKNFRFFRFFNLFFFKIRNY